MVFTKVEQAIKDVVTNFYKHTTSQKLNGVEFNKMMKEFENILTNTEFKEAVDKLKTDLDKDGDKKISFREYWNLITTIANSDSEQRSKE